ncbi:MAG: metallophosphoesterase [Lachnospiraceae bacterium]|nr:metallophosphoesterase [Lachnospiraceae bacterium]
MKVLVVGDIHLKPWVIESAKELMNSKKYDNTVFLGDFVDDFDEGRNLGLYNETFDALDRFRTAYPDALICYGNHDLSYLWRKSETGYSEFAEQTVQRWLMSLRRTAGDNLQFVHRINNVIFSHGGITRFFLEEHFEGALSVDDIIYQINQMGPTDLWMDHSPLWSRPFRKETTGLTKYNVFDGKYLQVIGHTPVHTPTFYERENILACDSFGRHHDGTRYGDNKYVWVDTETKEWGKI